MRGGKREGAGRPTSPLKPKPTTIRFESFDQLSKYQSLGGQTWLRTAVEKAKISKPIERP